MRTLPAELLNLIVVFQPLFTKPVWEHTKILLMGVLLARGKRTVTSCLRAVGLIKEKHFQNYHRVLNRAKWDTLRASQILLGLIVALLPAGGVVVIAADDTVERRRGKKLHRSGGRRQPFDSGRLESIAKRLPYSVKLDPLAVYEPGTAGHGSRS